MVARDPEIFVLGCFACGFAQTVPVSMIVGLPSGVVGFLVACPKCGTMCRSQHPPLDEAPEVPPATDDVS